MKILVAGASGVIGRRLVPLLVSTGHDVVGTTRTSSKGFALRAAGAAAQVLDILDAGAVLSVLEKVRPDVVVHQATAIPGRFNPRQFDRVFALTNRLRSEGTDNLLRAAQTT